jgi:hypothetical protein
VTARRRRRGPRAVWFLAVPVVLVAVAILVRIVGVAVLLALTGGGGFLAGRWSSRPTPSEPSGGPAPTRSTPRRPQAVKPARGPASEGTPAGLWPDAMDRAVILEAASGLNGLGWKMPAARAAATAALASARAEGAPDGTAAVLRRALAAADTRAARVPPP